MIRFFPSTIRVAGGFEPEYQAVLDRATALGYTTPDNATNIRNNKRVKYLKNTGLWAKFDLLYFFDQPTGLDDFAKLNYIDPLLYEAFNANPALEPDFIADSGYKSDGTKWFNSGFNASINGVNFQNSTNVLARGSVIWKGFDWVADATVEYVTGARTGNNNLQILIGKITATTSLLRIGTTLSAFNLAAAQYNTHILFSSSGQSSGLPTNTYSDGTALGLGSGMSGLLFSNLQLYIFAANFSNVGGSISKSGLKYFGLASYLGGTDPNQEAIDLYEIMDDIYVP